MPAATYSTLTLANSGASLTAVLTDHTNYQLLVESWSPAIAGEKVGEMGGRPYNRVTESIRLLVTGTSQANALENVEKLVRLLKLAEQWRYSKARGVGGPTLLKLEIQGSSEGTWSSLVLGRVDPGRNYTIMPVSFSERLTIYKIEGVMLELLREGEWLGAISAPLDVATGASGDKLTIEYAANWPIPGPLLPQIVDIGGVNAPDLQESYLFLAYDEGDIQILEAEDASGGGTVTDEDSNNARGTAGANALQLEGDLEYQSITFSFPASAIQHKSVAVYAMLRNDGDAEWRFYLETTRNGIANDESRVTSVDTSSSDPRPHFFGSVESAMEWHDGLTLYYAVNSVSGTPTLTIDYLVLIGLDNPVNRVIHLIPQAGMSNITDFTINPRQLTGMSPQIVAYNSSSQQFAIPWDSGDAYCLSSGDKVTALWMAASGDKWRWSQTGGTLISNLSFSAQRQRCVLIPR